MPQTLNDIYSDAEKAILQNGLVFKNAEAGLKQQLANFSLTSDKAGEIISQFYLSLTGTTIAAAIELAFKQKEDARQELLAEKEIELRTEEILLKKKEVELRTIEIKYAERKTIAEVKALEIEKGIQREKLKLEEQKVELEKAKAKVTKSQEVLITRQARGYDDQLLIKVAEFQSGVASNVFNSAPDNPTAQDTVDRFNKSVVLLQDRMCGLTCTVPSTEDRTIIASKIGEIT